MDIGIGNRIIIVGCCGSGKSTFARKLYECTRIPLFHLDNIWWKPDMSHISRDEFDEKLEKILHGDQWIIDGDYSRTYETRIKACDTIIFLDYSEEECMKGITQRVGEKRSDIPWVEDHLDPELVEMVQRFHDEKRPVLYGLLEKYPDKKKIIFNTRHQADEWLSQYRSQQD